MQNAWAWFIAAVILVMVLGWALNKIRKLRGQLGSMPEVTLSVTPISWPPSNQPGDATFEILSNKKILRLHLDARQSAALQKPTTEGLLTFRGDRYIGFTPFV